MEIDLEQVAGDMEIEDFYRRNDRGKAVLKRLGVAINEPEKATVLSKEEVVGKILRRESFCVSIETLERVADELQRLQRVIVEYETAKANDEALCERADEETADGSELSDELYQLMDAAADRWLAAASTLRQVGKELTRKVSAENCGE